MSQYSAGFVPRTLNGRSEIQASEAPEPKVAAESFIDRLGARRANGLRALLLGVLSLAVFLPRLSVTRVYIYDEQCYVSSARAFLSGTGDTNPEHPPLGKLLIALSMKAFGDNPFGWRSASVLAGAAIVVGMFYLALRL